MVDHVCVPFNVPVRVPYKTISILDTIRTMGKGLQKCKSLLLR